MRITGVIVQYYISCHRELWFYSHGINMNFEDQNILLGRLLHETAFKREKKNIIIDNTIAIDFASSRDNVVVFEIKKSRKLTKPAEYQLLYYLYYLKQMGVEDARGVLVYPKERRREPIELTLEKENEIHEIVREIEEIVKREEPPEIEKRPHCRGCSYYDFCKV
jgi:CRISPR-associated exonuclease Cas4